MESSLMLVFGKILVLGSMVLLALGNGFVRAQTPAPILFVQAGEKSEFPLPETVENLTAQPGVAGTESVNFQTDLTLTEAVEFYRRTLTERGLKEREINTAITETTFNLVFEGAENGLAVVVQGVDLGKSTNVNVRYEQLN